MKHLYPILFTLFLFSYTTQAQSTRELFSRPGLTISTSHYNWVDGYYNLSLRYLRDSVVCNDTLLLFQYTGYPNTYELLSIDSGKVYRVYSPNCSKQLYYDFDLEVGDIFNGTSSSQGTLYVIEKDIFTLENNEQRRRLKLASDPSQPQYNQEWVEGIGNKRQGLLPHYFDFEGFGTLICARDSSAQLISTPGAAALCDSLSCQVPYAGFQLSTSGKVVTFTNTTINAYSYLWDFGDGTTSNETNPVHEYAQPGCYTVVLKAYTFCLVKPNIYTISAGICLEGGWDPRPMPATQSATDITFVNDSTGYLIAQSKLFRTTDSANTWEEVALPAHPVNGNAYLVTGISMVNRDSGVVRGGYSGGGASSPNLLFTTDGGVTWSPSFIDPDDFYTGQVMRPGGHVACPNLYTHIYFSTDYGQQWNLVNYPALGTNGLTHAVGVTTAGNAFCVYGFKETFGVPVPNFPFLFFTKDNGVTWKTVSLYGEYYIFGVSFLDEMNGWVTGKGGNLLHTTDGGQSWDHIATGVPHDLNDVKFTDPLNGWAVGSNGTIVHTTDGGLTWSRENCGSTTYFTNVAATSPETAYASGGFATLLKYQPYSVSPCETNATTAYYEKNPADWTIIPNPANSHITLNINTEIVESRDITLRFSNVWGQQVQEIQYTGSSGEIDVAKLPAGMYFVKITGNGLNLPGKLFVKI